MRRIFDTTATGGYPFWIFDGKQPFWADKNLRFVENSYLSLDFIIDEGYQEIAEFPNYLQVDEGL